MEIKEILKQRRKELNLTLAQVAKACGVSEGTVSRWESGDIDNMKRSRIAALAKILNIHPYVIVGDVDDDEMIYQSAGIDFIRVPLYPPICCGNGGFVDDDIIEFVPVPSKGLSSTGDYFCQIASGDSMKDAGIEDGDLLVFEKAASLDYGKIGCFCIDDNEAMCKKYTVVNGLIILQPMNSDYEPIIVDPLNESFKCVGVLKKSIKDFSNE